MMQLLALVLALVVQGCFSAQMDVVHSWRGVDFNFPNNAARDAMMRAGKFIPANIAIVDVDVWEAHDGATQKIIVTMPRFKPGTPATLASVGLTGLLTPYPDWDWHREGNCDGITSVFRIEVDQCGRLWVLDSGTVEIFEQEPKMICPPQILVFDMNTDKLIGRYRFPSDVLDPKSLLVTIVVDTRDSKCQNTFAYVADVVSFKLIVFDAKNQKSWRVSNNYFYPYPLHGSFDIAGVNFDLMDGILGLALGPMVKGDRRLYFHSLASVRESWVQTSVLQNSTHFTDGDGSPRSFHVSAYTRPSQSAAQAMTKSGILFFGLLSQNSIACWNSRLSYTKDNIITVAKDNTKLQFPTGLKIRNGYLWVLTSRFQNFITGVFDKYNANFRILVASLDVLTHGTSCHYPSDGPLYNSPSIYNQSAIWSPFDHYIFYK